MGKRENRKLEIEYTCNETRNDHNICNFNMTHILSPSLFSCNEGRLQSGLSSWPWQCVLYKNIYIPFCSFGCPSIVIFVSGVRCRSTLLNRILSLNIIYLRFLTLIVYFPTSITVMPFLSLISLSLCLSLCMSVCLLLLFSSCSKRT